MGDSGRMVVGEVLHQLLESWYFDLGSSWKASKVVVPCNSVEIVVVAQMGLALAAPN